MSSNSISRLHAVASDPEAGEGVRGLARKLAETLGPIIADTQRQRREAEPPPGPVRPTPSPEETPEEDDVCWRP